MRHVLLLRGINVGNRRVPMPELRELLSGAGFEDVATYVQSGNVVLSSDEKAADVATACQRLISERFGFDVPVIVRTPDQLEAVIARNPFPEALVDPKRYQVSFLDRPADSALVAELEQLATPEERFAAVGSEFYGWHPGGVARSGLWNRLASRSLGIGATARNWTTVTKLLEMAST